MSLYSSFHGRCIMKILPWNQLDGCVVCASAPDNVWKNAPNESNFHECVQNFGYM